MTRDVHYDVAVIGTGAGGGTLGHRLATSGKRVLWLERGPFLPRELDNWDTQRGVRAREVPRPGAVVGRRRPRVPARDQLLRRREHQVLRRRAVPAATPGLRRDHPPRRDLPRVADRLRRPGAVLLRGGAALQGARAPRRRPDGGSGQPGSTPSRRSRTRRGSSSSATTWRRPGCTRSTCRSASTCTRTRAAGPPATARASAAARSTASPACSAPRATRRPSASSRRSRLDNVTLVTEANVRRLETDPTGRTVTVDRHRRGRRDGVVHRRRRGGLLRRGELRGAAAAVGLGHAPRRAREQLGRRRAALHAPQQLRGDGRLARAEPDHLPEDHGDERLVPRRGRLGLPARRHPDARQVGRGDDPRGGAAVRRQALARHAVRDAGPPRRRLLALRRGPPPSGEPGHARRGRRRST